MRSGAKSLVNFELVFVLGEKPGSSFSLWHVDVWFSQHHFFKKGQTQEKKNPLYTREGRGLRGHAKDKHSLDTVLYLPFN